MTDRIQRRRLLVVMLLLLALVLWWFLWRHPDTGRSGGNASAPWVPGTPQSLKLYYLYVHAHPNSAAARSSLDRLEKLESDIKIPLTKEVEPFLARLRELYPEVTFTLWRQGVVPFKEGEETPFEFGPSPDDPLHFEAKFKFTVKRLTRTKVAATKTYKVHYTGKEGKVVDSPWQPPSTGERLIDLPYAYLLMPDDQGEAFMIICFRDEQASP